jgi:hypothetical protein
MRVNRDCNRNCKGGALAEFVIIAPILTLLWASLDYFRVSYMTRLQVAQAAKTEAWQAAIAGRCERGALSVSPFAAVDYGKLGDEALASFKLLPGSGSILDGVASVERQVTLAAPAPGGVLGFLTRNADMRGRAYVSCNDQPPSPHDSVLPKLLPIAPAQLRVQ